MSVMRKAAAIAAGSLFMLGALAVPAEARNNTVVQDGLVNITIGDVTVTDTIDAAVLAAVNACGIDVGPIALLAAQQADTTGDKTTICRNEDGRVRITNN